jgi:formylglycine-generating enzyme required for sulfatase activity
MAGNVLEWTSSAYKEYPYNPGDGREDLDAKENRVMRGGSLSRPSRDVRCAYRYGEGPPDDGSYDVGFRVILPAD